MSSCRKAFASMLNFCCTEPLLVRNINPSYFGNTFPLKFTICVKVWDLLSLS